jgi:hypothetical protein
MNCGQRSPIPVDSGPGIGLVDIRHGFGRCGWPAIAQFDIWQMSPQGVHGAGSDGAA